MKNVKLVKAFRTTENEVKVLYTLDLSEFVVSWNNIHPETGEVVDYDLQYQVLANNENLIGLVENAIQGGETGDENGELYCAIRDTFDMLDCKELEQDDEQYNI